MHVQLSSHECCELQLKPRTTPTWFAGAIFYRAWSPSSTMSHDFIRFAAESVPMWNTDGFSTRRVFILDSNAVVVVVGLGCSESLCRPQAEARPGWTGWCHYLVQSGPCNIVSWFETPADHICWMKMELCSWWKWQGVRNLMKLRKRTPRTSFDSKHKVKWLEMIFMKLGDYVMNQRNKVLGHISRADGTDWWQSSH